MLKIFVTGDNHIGLVYAGHREGAALARERISAFDNMVQEAIGEGCALFVITGDLFESNEMRFISLNDIKEVVSKLALFPGRVCILPGNHDYYDESKEFWRVFEEETRSATNIMLLSESRPYTFTAGGEEVVLYPAPCTSLHSKQNNLGPIKGENILPDKTYRVGIAHGAVEGETIDREERYFFMKKEELLSVPVDVWLVGHTHVPFPKDLKTDEYTYCNQRIFNAGTHVQTDVNCNTEGLCFIVEIGEDKRVRAKKFVSGSLRFYRRKIAPRAGHFREDLLSALSDIGNKSVVDVSLSGAVLKEEYEDRANIYREAGERFLEWRCRDDELAMRITEEKIDSEFPETSFSAAFLKELLKEPKEAQLAYDLIKSLKGERK